jgi:HD superfamily phosphohydrolase YqeK
MTENIGQAKEKIKSLLQTIQRPGIAELYGFMESGDFFTAPASTKYHDAHVGGLAFHSLKVYELLKHKVEYFNYPIDPQTIIICGLLHDICKMNTYKLEVAELATQSQLTYISSLLSRINGNIDIDANQMTKHFASLCIDALKNSQPVPDVSLNATSEYKYNDTFPCGHGEKSVIMIQRYMQLTDLEILAIRWHMGFSDPSYNQSFTNTYREAMHLDPLIILLFTSDFEAITKNVVHKI